MERLHAALRAGAVIGLPTDTVYGLATAWDSPKGVARLFEAKGRDQERPLAVLFASLQHVQESLPDFRRHNLVSARTASSRAIYLRGGNRRPKAAARWHRGLASGVRVPAHPRLLQLLDAMGTPLAATSANRSGSAEVAQVTGLDFRAS